MSDFKPAVRIKDPALMTLLKWECDECELTGETDDLHLHHVIFKSHSGDDLRQNIICVVEWMHSRIHAGDPVAKQHLSAHVEFKRTDIAGYISEKLGGPDALLEWFNRHDRALA